MNSRFKDDVQKLFEYWCEISPNTSGNGKSAGHIVESFPENYKDTEIITKIPEFAYPCPFANESIQTYSFVLTSSDSKWRFGFCRHDPRNQKAMIIITYLPWHDTFIRFLNVIGELKRLHPEDFQPFLSEAYKKGVPEPGASLKLFYNAGINHFMFQRPSQFQLPSIPENHNLNLYYNFVEPKNMIAIFAAMLAERRIVFTSKRLDKLSSCVQAANAFLYPMIWQHIFIPILPMKMKEILCAPMPFLIGVPEPVLHTITREELGDAVILDCDRKYLETPFDDVKNMPTELVAQLKKQLSNPNEHIGDRVSKIFLGILVQLIGGYRDAIKFSQGEKITWDRDTFIDSRPPHLRSFLKNMMELQIFQQFIDERLEMLNTGLGFSDEFELETLRHLEKSGKKSKHYKEFLRNVKDKTNPAVKSAVQSVKQGSRGVKTAYKDLKSKLQERTPTKYGNGHIDQPGHHSAPNSPVFTKRLSTDQSLHRKNPSVFTTSNSLSNNPNFYTNNNHHPLFNKSPTVSPPSSNSSSEMNILQELQQHALFKSAAAAIDRSLKPAFNSEYITGRSGAIMKSPQYSLHDSAPTAIIGSFHESGPTSDTSCTSSSFDSPPEMPSPPVPPRISNPPSIPSPQKPQSIPLNASFVSYTNANKLSKTNNSSLIPLSMSFENNFVNNDSFSSKTFRRRNNGITLPTVLPKIEPTNIHTKTETDANSTNLINLDTTPSFDIEDFDPLNQNAKPLPISIPSTSNPILPSTSTNSSRVQAFSNPIYPFYTPIHGPLSAGQPLTIHRKSDEDLELLRKYGLDKFHISDTKQTDSISSSSSLTTSGTPLANGCGFNSSGDTSKWTKFD